MLGPFEFVNLEWVSILTPADLMTETRAIFVRVGAPKMRRLGARREHVRIDVPEVVSFTIALKAAALAKRHVRVLAGGAKQFRKSCDALFRFFGASVREGSGVTPASFRAGGATFWYKAWQDTEKVRYRGRWMSSRMLEIYIQEVMADTVLVALLPEERETFSIFAAAAAAAMAAVVAA